MDFDTLTWKETFWNNPAGGSGFVKLAETTWNLAATDWAKYDPDFVSTLTLPDLSDSADTVLTHTYQFADGDNHVTTRAEYLDHIEKDTSST